METVKKHFPGLVRYVHDVSHEANTATYNCEEFSQQWRRALEHTTRERTIQEYEENISVDDLVYESTTTMCEKLVQSYVQQPDLDLSTILVPTEKVTQDQPLASMALTDLVHKGGKNYFAKSMNYLHRAKQDFQNMKLSADDVVLRITFYNQENKL